MKKKGINIIVFIAIAVVVVAAIVLIIVLKTPDDREMNGENSLEKIEESVFNLQTIEQFDKFAKSGKYEYSIGDDRSGGSILSIPVLGMDAVVTYYFDSQGNTTDLEAFYYFNAGMTEGEISSVEEITNDDVAISVKDTIREFCLMFGCNFVPDYYFTNDDGTFTKIEADSDFQKIIDESAYIRFSVRDKDGYYWELTISASHGLIGVSLNKYFDIAGYMDYVANISLYE